MIFYNFWCNEDERKEFVEILKKNEAKKQEDLSKEYNYENLFKKDTKIEEVNEILPVVVKETWVQKLFNQFKKFFYIKK